MVALGGATANAPAGAALAPPGPAVRPGVVVPQTKRQTAVLGCVRVGLLPPVDAGVSDPFRPPAGPFGPGNRGLEYATVAGQPVRAVGAGPVRFAGRIGSAWYVTVDLGGGLAATFSYLADVTVAAGQSVGAGMVIGYTGPARFHLGIRRGGAYLDPAPLIEPPGRLRVRLVPDRRFGDGGGPCAR